MIKVKLPDGTIKEVAKGTNSLDIAKSISEGLARKVLAAEINGEVWDLNRSLNEDVNLKLLTFEDKGGKSTLWHSSAHILAEALEYFYPGINLAIGPPIENGFYYDIDFQDYNISEKDLEKIEKKIIELAREKNPFVRKEMRKFEIKNKNKMVPLPFILKENSQICVEGPIYQIQVLSKQ